MVISAEALFNYLGRRYEDAYANSPRLCSTVELVMEKLKPNSDILDVGCGTGKPVSYMLAAAGHKVYGIDVAQKMVDVARQQVSGEFQKADMRTFEPNISFDAIFAVYSLFQISPSETHAVVFKFAEWLNEDGILIMGVTPSTSLHSSTGVHDPTWGCVRVLDKPWMTETTDEVFFSRDDWRRLIESAGLTIWHEKLFTFYPEDPDHQTPEDHYLLVVKKSQKIPLIGPYPIPVAHHGPYTLDGSSWKRFTDRVSSADLESTITALMGNGRSLGVSNGYGGLTAPIVKCNGEIYLMELNGTPNEVRMIDCGQLERQLVRSAGENFPFPDAHFESAVGMWVLDHVENTTKTLEEFVRIVDKSAPQPRIMILQGAPWNEIVRFQNAICAPLGKNRKTKSHQGYLLDTAMRVFSTHGFSHITLKPISMHCSFMEECLTERCSKAAEVLVNLWYHGDPNQERMKESLIPQLQLHFKDKPHEVGYDMILLVAEPSVA